VLLGGILVVLALYAAVVGIVAVRRLAFGMWGLALFAFIGLWAALTRPGSTADYLWPTLAGAAAGAFTLARLAGAATQPKAPPPPGGGGARPRPRRRTAPRRTCRMPRPLPNPGRTPPSPFFPTPTTRGRPAGPHGGGSWSAAE